MKKGDLYILKKRNGSHHALFPYFSGGQVLILSVKEETMVKPLKGYEKIKVVEFLFAGKVYLESIESFKENSEKVGEACLSNQASNRLKGLC